MREVELKYFVGAKNNHEEVQWLKQYQEAFKQLLTFPALKILKLVRTLYSFTHYKKFSKIAKDDHVVTCLQTFSDFLANCRTLKQLQLFQVSTNTFQITKKLINFAE